MKNDKKISVKQIALAGIAAAFIFVGTYFIHVPTAIGYVNLGDAFILIFSFLLGPFAAIPAAIGSALGDLIAGYPQYILPTFIIKGAMGFVAGLLMIHKKGGNVSVIRRIIAGVVAEVIMIAGYFLFESLPFMYGPEAAAGSIIPNIIQATAALVVFLPISLINKIKVGNDKV